MNSPKIPANENLSSLPSAHHRQETKMREGSQSAAATSSHQAAEKTTHSASPWNHLAEFQRQQIALATECASALFRGIESIRKTQQEAAHQASAHHASTTQKLRSTEQAEDWLALMSAPLCIDMEGAEKYWKQLAAASVQVQTEMMSSLHQIFDNEGNFSANSIQEVIQAAIPPMASSFFVDGAHERPHHA